VTKRPFAYRGNEQHRVLRISLAALENGNPEPFVNYVNNGGRITDESNWGRLADALSPEKKTRGKPADTSEAAVTADIILVRESRWRKANPENRLPRGYRTELVERQVQAAWRDDGQLQSTYRKKKDPADRRLCEQEYKDLVRNQILDSLENKRKNESRRK